MRIVVIGAGVVGVSIAVRLAQRGASVTLVDQAWPGSGTSSTSYAWINSHNKQPDSYYALNLAGMRAHQALCPQGAGWLRPGGHVEIAVDRAHIEHLRGRMDLLSSLGYEVEEVSVGRARELLPDVIVPDDADTIAYFAQEAYCHPLLYLAHMLAEARLAGVTIRDHTAVTALAPNGEGARVTFGDRSVISADTVVSAAGRWTADVAALAGGTVPMATFTEPGDVTVGYLLETNPLPVRLNRIVTSPWLNVRPDGGGRLLLQALDLDASADPGAVPAVDSPLALTFLERLRAVVRNTGAGTIRHIAVGQRVMPADGLTIVGRVPGAPWLYAVATHSGVTLAPFLGDAVAEEVFGHEEERFADYRPDRFRSAAGITPPRLPRKPGDQ